MKTQPLRTLIGLLLVLELALLALPQQSQAYSNAARSGDWTVGGPHRTINEFALNKYIEQAKSDPVLSKYDFTNATLKVSGPRSGEPSTFPHVISSGAGTEPEPFLWWVKEGGYSADEPELYASFRHFYDPRANELGRPAYLTDHLDKVAGLFRVIAIGMAAHGNPVAATIVDDLGRNPEVDARDWAINGTEHKGWGENEYSWNQGVKYIQKAFSSTDPADKSKLFAQGWRALGETMHLLADMTTPAHVRNDSHPAVNQMIGDSPESLFGMLKGDAYEAYAQEGMIRRVGQAAIEPEMKDYIAAGDTPDKLFDRVAMFTNTGFFSAETVAGTDKRTGIVYHNANGMPDYPAPSLEQTEYKNGQFVKRIGSKDVCLARVSWLTAIGWGTASPSMTAACVETQAAVLVPVAVAADAQLLDWFIPRVQVEITSVDTERRSVQGTVTHKPRGAYSSEMKFSTATKAFGPLRLSGTTLDPDDYQVTVQNGVLRVTYGDDTARRIETVRASGSAVVNVLIDMGGIYVQSNDFTLSKTTPTPTPTSRATSGSGSTGAWVLKLVQPNVGKTEVQFSFAGLECNGGTKVTSTETSGTITTNGTCKIKGAQVANASTNHSWSRPPDRLTPGQELSGTMGASQSGLCYWSAVATEEGCRRSTTTSHIVWQGDGWPGGPKEFPYDHLVFGNDSANTARALDHPTGSFKWTVPKGSTGSGTLVLQFLSHADGGQVYTNFWYAWDATLGQ